MPAPPRSADARALTIFSTAKPFRGHSALIQRNAISSWCHLSPRPEVILFGDDEGVAGLCQELGLRHVPGVKASESGAPLVSDMFEQAQLLASNETLCFVNADIILPQPALEAAAAVSAAFRRFLLVARRVDLDLDEPIDFGRPDWAAALRRRARGEGAERGDLAIDWFVFPKGLFGPLPEFAIGRTRYDNWLIWRAAEAGAEVVDASAFVTLVHQNHDYGHWSHYHSIAHARLALSADGEVVPATGLRYRLARPRRLAAHLLRFTRPWRRRLKLGREGLRGYLRHEEPHKERGAATAGTSGPAG